MRTPRRGQIFRLKSDAVGKPRPILVVSRTELNNGSYLLGIAFYGEQLEKRAALPHCILFQAGEFGLTKNCVAMASGITQFKLTELRLAEGPLGELSPEQMAVVDRALAFSLNLTLAENSRTKDVPSSD